MPSTIARHQRAAFSRDAVQDGAFDLQSTLGQGTKIRVCLAPPAGAYGLSPAFAEPLMEESA